VQQAAGAKSLDQRLAAGIASVTARVVIEQARAFDSRPQSPIAQGSRRRAADAWRIGAELAGRLDASKLQRFAARLESGGVEPGALDRLIARMQTEALSVLAVFAERAWARLSVHHPALADAYHSRIGQYLPVLAAQVADAIRAELEDEFSIRRTEQEPEEDEGGFRG